MPIQRRKGGEKWQKLTARQKLEHKLNGDGTIWCHLCDRPIDLDAISKSMDSLSWDHIVPVSVDPAREYDPRNVAPAHLVCNLIRQSKPINEINGTPERLELFRKRVDLRRAEKALAETELRPVTKAEMTIEEIWQADLVKWGGHEFLGLDDYRALETVIRGEAPARVG